MKKRTMIFITAMVLLFAIVTGSTIAYMTSKSATVTNTFTYGNIKITLDEAPVDANGKKTTGTRGTANEYKLIAGSTYDKDPTVHIAANSESCYIFVNVQNNLKAQNLGGATIDSQMTNLGWKKATSTGAGTNCTVWYKATAFATSNDVQDVVLFNTIDIATSVQGSETTSSSSVVIEAYAVQSANLDTAVKAYNAAPLSSGTSITWPSKIA